MPATPLELRRASRLKKKLPISPPNLRTCCSAAHGTSDVASVGALHVGHAGVASMAALAHDAHAAWPQGATSGSVRSSRQTGQRSVRARAAARSASAFDNAAAVVVGVAAWSSGCCIAAGLRAP